MGLEVSLSAAFDNYECVIDIAYPNCWFLDFEGCCLEFLQTNFSDVAKNMWAHLGALNLFVRQVLECEERLHAEFEYILEMLVLEAGV